MRWEHPDLGLVPPLEFIPLAEETGLIVPLGKWVLEEACRQTREWQELYSGSADPLPIISVNLSARQFKQPDLAETIAQVLRKNCLEPRSLILEITESMMVTDVDSIIVTLQELRELGVRIAIDDFGTGYSSLAYLKRLPVDYLKIDRSFVDGLGRDPTDKGLVSAALTLAHTLGLEAVAEGVETADQVAHLRELGCKLAQGYYFWKPSPSERASELLAARFPP